MDSTGTAWNDLGPGLFGLSGGLDALADWLSGERIEAAPDTSFAAADWGWIVEDEPPLIDNFLSLDGDAFLFGSEAPTPDAGRVPEAQDAPSAAAADLPGESLLADAGDGDADVGLFADQPGFDAFAAEATGGDAGDPDAAAVFASIPDPEGIDTGEPPEPSPAPSLSDMPTDMPGPLDPDLPGEVPDTIPTDDGGVVSVADLDDGFDFLL